MKLATYRESGATKIGAVDAAGARVFDLAAASVRAGAATAPFASMLSLIDSDDPGLDLARMLLEKLGGEGDLWSSLAGVELLAPVPEPRQMRDGMSFATHIRQSARGARGDSGDEDGRSRSVPRRDGGAARRIARDLSPDPHLLHHQPTDGRRAGNDRILAALQQGDGLRARDRCRDEAHPRQHPRR